MARIYHKALIKEIRRIYQVILINKLGLLYERIHDMATNQANFNSMIKESVDKLSGPIQSQIDLMQKENQVMHNELKRTQMKNREILTTFGAYNEDNLRVSELGPPNFK